MTPTSVMCHRILEVCDRLGDSESASRIQAIMAQHKIDLTHAAYVSLICAHGRAGNLAAVKAIIKEMTGSLVRPDLEIFTSAIFFHGFYRDIDGL